MNEKNEREQLFSHVKIPVKAVLAPHQRPAPNRYRAERYDTNVKRENASTAPRTLFAAVSGLTSIVIDLQSTSSPGRSLMSLSRLHVRAHAIDALTIEGPRAPLSRRPWYEATSSPNSLSPCQGVRGGYEGHRWDSLITRLAYPGFQLCPVGVACPAKYIAVPLVSQYPFFPLSNLRHPRSFKTTTSQRRTLHLVLPTPSQRGSSLHKPASHRRPQPRTHNTA